MADIFISYNREDRRAAGAVASGLEREGFSVWWDAALRAGESYDEVTEKNLREAKAVVVLWSKRSAVSKWVRAEATIGERHSTLVPVMIEECDRPLRFELIQTADLTRWHGDTEDHNWRQFVGDIRRAVGDKADGGSKQNAPLSSPGAGNAVGDDATIETTFWTSIKDGSDPSDFEAYLQRYPHGHFAALAQNRLAALARAKAAPITQQHNPTPPPAQQQPQRPPQQSATAAPQQARTQSAKQHPPKSQAAQSRAQSSAPRQAEQAPKKGGAGMIIGLSVVGLAAIAGVVFLALRGGGNGVGGTDTRIADADSVLVEQTSENAGEGSGDSATAPDLINANGATDTPASLSDDATIVSEGSDVGDQNEQITDDADPIADVLGNVAMSEGEANNSGASTDLTEAEDAASAGGAFSDCDACPRLVEIPAGKFMMGSPSDEIGRNGYEGPQREVDVEAFLIGETEVTAAEWAACVEDGGCNGYEPGDEGYGGGDMPAMNISWRDANAYTSWLTSKTGKKYRLPTEAEWEYAARSGAETRYWWGDTFERDKTAIGAPKPVGSFEANAFGLKDVTGNVREWVADCYVNNYADRPADARAVTDGDCSRRVIRGGSWQNQPNDLRVANRIRITSSVRDDYLGFRVARDK